MHAHSIESDSLDDGHKYTPTSLYSWLSTYMYDRRTKINPLWNTIVVGGYHDNKPYVNAYNYSFQELTCLHACYTLHYSGQVSPIIQPGLRY